MTEICRKALAEDPQFVEARSVLAAALYNLGNTRARSQDLGGAAEAYEMALRLDPKDGDAKHNLELVRALMQQQPPDSSQQKQQNKDKQNDKDQKQKQQDQDKKQQETGGWLYAGFNGDGTPSAVDPVKNCYECHLKEAKDRDFVISRHAQFK